MARLLVLFLALSIVVMPETRAQDKPKEEKKDEKKADAEKKP